MGHLTPLAQAWDCTLSLEVSQSRVGSFIRADLSTSVYKEDTGLPCWSVLIQKSTARLEQIQCLLWAGKGLLRLLWNDILKGISILSKLFKWKSQELKTYIRTWWRLMCVGGGTCVFISCHTHSHLHLYHPQKMSTLLDFLRDNSTPSTNYEFQELTKFIKKLKFSVTFIHFLGVPNTVQTHAELVN